LDEFWDCLSISSSASTPSCHIWTLNAISEDFKVAHYRLTGPLANPANLLHNNYLSHSRRVAGDGFRGGLLPVRTRKSGK